MLSEHVGNVSVVNAKTPADDILQMNPDGIFLSNGPGDPEPCDYAIKNIQKFLEIKFQSWDLSWPSIIGISRGSTN